MKTIIKLTCIVLSVFLVNCTASLPKDIPPVSQTYKNKVDLRIMVSRRSYLVHVPPIHDPQQPLPLVVAIHGAFDTAKGMENISGFSNLADHEGFVAVYPNGFGLFGLLQHWNAGHCCGKAAADNVDDVDFLGEVIADVQKRLPIDPDRIYMVGFSNGGMLAYHFAAHNGGILAALATVAATVGSKPSANEPVEHIQDPVTPLPLIALHGLADEAIPAEGGVSPKRGGTQSFLSVKDSTDFWAGNNGCNALPVLRKSHQSQVHIQTWQGCRQDAGVVLYQMEDWGHIWPGLYYTANLENDNPLKNFDAATIIWNFFKAHTREP